eukprot:m.197756 g.197756  ORF g.197756 m.197756 type:complete len:251 (-) comp20212_c0_seq1:140-892(-)
MDLERIKLALLAINHAGVILTAVLVFANWPPVYAWYRRCLMLSVIPNLYRTAQRRGSEWEISGAYVNKIMSEDAFHYVMFATVLYGARPTSIAVVIPAIYAFFKLLPMVALLVPRYQGRIANFIQGKGGQPMEDGTIAQTRSEQGFRMAATLELFLFAILWSRVLTDLSLHAAMVAVAYSNFTMLRYNSLRNPRSRQTWSALRLSVEGIARSPRCPSFVVNFILSVLDKIDRSVAFVQAQADAQAQPQAR